MSRDVKYIGYLELEIADTMWPSGLCRVGGGARAQHARPGRVGWTAPAPLVDIALRS
jgi:hypothetical protein